LIAPADVTMGQHQAYRLDPVLPLSPAAWFLL
jgi:hypothetical protein